MSDREQWFMDRIGKRIWRNETGCECEICAHIYKEGIIFTGEYHAGFACDMEGCSQGSLKYFDSKEEVTEFEKTVKKS